MSFFYKSLKNTETFLSSLANQLLPPEHPNPNPNPNPYTNIQQQQQQLQQQQVTASAPSPSPLSSLPSMTNEPQQLLVVPNEKDEIWESKEQCLKYYSDLLTGYQQQIDTLGIVPHHLTNINDTNDNNVLTQLDHHLTQLDQNVPQWKPLLLQYMILTQITAPILALRASLKGKQHFDIFQNLIHNVALMNDIVDGGGLSLNCDELVKAMNLYNTIRRKSKQYNQSNRTNANNSKDDIFHRLALAVALEYTQPKHIFDDPNTNIDPWDRYFHYEKAYLNGELDPYFPTLTIWELRMVVNNDASNDEIQWCRTMMRNYRPDHILNPDYNWRYCRIVKSEIRYKTPDWKQYPKTYKQLISGGGKCGPRAWFGRYACKSFGIPTWGIKQPGHAAMSHWMPISSNKSNHPHEHQWVICLGGQNWQKSHWDKTNGEEFDLEARARSFPNLFHVVLWLRCFECMEDNNGGKGGKKGGKQSNKEANRMKQFWNHLQLLKMKQIAFENHDDDKYLTTTTTTTTTTLRRSNDPNYKSDHFVPTSIERLMQRQCDNKLFQKESSLEPHADITFQASDYVNTKISKNVVIVMKSFHSDGGDQVHLRDGGRLTYTIDVPEEVVENRKQQHFIKYSLSCQVVTVHAETKPLLLKVKNGIQEMSYQVEIPYTEGEWANTQPVEVELLEGKRNQLFFDREEGALGLTMKDFTLKRL